MRILIVDTCYPAFLAGHYAAQPGLEKAPYKAQWRALMDTFFGTADSYSHHLAELGHVAHEVVANCAPIQEAWAREHQARIPRLLPAPLRQQEIVLAQARWFQPDVVYVQNLRRVLEPTLRRLRRHTRLVVGQIASRPPRARKLHSYDLILTSLPHYVARFEAGGARAAYFRIGFDERVLGRLEAERAPFATGGATFVGALNRSQHAGGNAVLAAAAEQVPIDVWGYDLEGWPSGSALVNAYRGEAWGLDMYRRLRSARVALNRHIAVAEDNANNMRLYEATGVGAMLLTDAKRNLHELFEPGTEVVSYDGADDLAAKVRHYLEHEDERAAIAAAGQQRTLREHTYRTRMAELATILDDELGRRR
jgi:hypothetical protein